ncbi:MAG: hypothetical protein U0794_08465 [Isosphaeraceae bacterium]
MWARSSDQARELSERRENVRHLPGVRLPDPITISSDLAQVARAPI